MEQGRDTAVLVLERPPETVKGQMVTVVCGTRELHERLAGQTVAKIRAELASTLQIPSGAVAVLQGQRVAPSDEGQTIVGPGTVEFVKHTGIKG